MSKEVTEVTNWETVEVPRGAYLGWGTKKGQHVTGKVLEYSPDGRNAEFPFGSPSRQVSR